MMAMLLIMFSTWLDYPLNRLQIKAKHNNGNILEMCIMHVCGTTNTASIILMLKKDIPDI